MLDAFAYYLVNTFPKMVELNYPFKLNEACIFGFDFQPSNFCSSPKNIIFARLTKDGHLDTTNSLFLTETMFSTLTLLDSLV